MHRTHEFLMMMLSLGLCLNTLAARDVSSFNDDWKFARFGPMPDGIVDLCGFPKDRFYLYQARWRPDLPMAHILPHWNWPERVGEITPVFVYTSGDEAELFLNGESRGRKQRGAFDYRLRWDDVVYQPGEPARLELSHKQWSMTADGVDLTFVTVKVVDKQGRLVPRTHNKVTYALSGPGEIIAVGNGDPTSHESFQALERKVFNGLALVVIRSLKDETGKITLVAESDGLQSTETNIHANPSVAEKNR